MNTFFCSKLEETDLVQMSKAGDNRAFSELVNRYQGAIYNLCFRMLGNTEEAEDAAQETFLRAFSRLQTYDDSRKLSSWLFSIGSHYCIDRLRRRRFTWVDVDELVPFLSTDRRDEQPEHAFLQAESERNIRKMLEGLSPAYRNIIVLRYWQQLSYAEIGEALQLSEPAVKTRLHRARKALAEKMLKEQRVDGRLRSVAMS